MDGWGHFAVWHLVESTVFALLLVLAVRLLRLGSSNLHCWIYRIGLLKFALPSVWLFGVARERFFSSASDETVVFGPLQDAAAQAAAAIALAGEPLGQALWGSAGVISALGALATLGLAWHLGCRIARGFRFHWRTRQDRQPFAPREAQVLRECSQGIVDVEGALVGTGPGIGLYGIFRPRIMARRAFLDSLSDIELATALQHEVAHRIRRDNLWCVIAEAIVCLFWFHPLVWALRSRMLFEMEKACDEQVISKRGDSSGYVNCLLKAAAFSSQGEVVGAVALSESYLKRRVRNVMEYQYSRISKMKLFLVNCVVGLLLLGSFTLSAVAEVKTSPLEDARNDDEDPRRDFPMGEADRERMEDLISQQVERRLAEAEASMKEHLHKVERDKRRLQEELHAASAQLEKVREHLSKEERLRMDEFQDIRAEALAQVEEAAKDLAKQREQFAREREMAQKERDRVMERREELAKLDRREELATEDRRAEKIYEIGSDDDDVKDLNELDTPPQAIYQVKPEYPPELKKKNISGWARLEWIITKEGNVANARVESSSNELFNEPALEAITKSKYKPGKKDGKTISVRVRQKLDFNLNDEE